MSSSELIDHEDWRQLGDLFIVAKRMVEGMHIGRHRSPRRGESTEFYDYKNYTPGDDLRRLDWKAFARTDRLFIRRFQHEADLSIHVIVDSSASMDFEGIERTTVSKWTYASQLAAALTYLAVRQSDRVGLSLIADECHATLPAMGTMQHMRQVVSLLESMSCAHETVPRRALSQAHQALRHHLPRRGVVVLISDLLGEPTDWLAGMEPLVHDRFDVMVLQVLHPEELDLSHSITGGARLVDAETDELIRVFGPAIHAGYRDRIRKHNERLQSGIVRLGLDYQLATTAQSPVETLRSILLRRSAG